MQKCESVKMPRREFFAAASGLMVGNAFFTFSSPLGLSASLGQKVKEELSDKDLDWIEQSSMAKELNKYFGRGYSCAESIVMVSLRYLDKPEEFAWAAAGFGGGLYHKDLCGFLTGGIMGLGFASSLLKRPRREAKKFCGHLVRQYWTWWESRAPFHCSEIRTKDASSQVCLNQGLLSASRIEELIEQIKNNT